MRRAPEDVTIDMPFEVMRMVREALKSGLYGDDLSEAIVTLMRPGLFEAVRIGAATLKQK